VPFDSPDYDLDELLKDIGANTSTLPTFRTSRDAELPKAIYRRVPVLVREGDLDGNPWGVSFVAMFHMANDSQLFHAEPDPGRVPLYEAKIVHQFNHRWATYDGGDARDTTADELADAGLRGKSTLVGPPAPGARDARASSDGNDIEGRVID
jgi:hypothetical protein